MGAPDSPAVSAERETETREPRLRLAHQEAFGPAPAPDTGSEMNVHGVPVTDPV